MDTMTFAPEQVAKLAEIGAELQQARLEKSLSLEAIAAKTMIRQSILEAIEAGQPDYLPEPVYTQGFIRRFAECLGLDGPAIAQRFPTHQLVSSPNTPPKASQVRLPGFQFRPVHLYLLYVVLVVGAVSGLSVFLKPQAPTTGIQPQASPSPAATNPSPSPTVSPTASPSPMTAASPSPTLTPAPSPISGEPVRVGVSITEDAWLEVVADGEVVYEGTLVKGDNKNWTAKEQIILRTGNAGAVVVSFNNNPAQAMGMFGDIEEKVYAATDPTGASDAALASPEPQAPISEPPPTNY